MTTTELTNCNFSPTYLSTNLLSPLRSPYRVTVPLTNIISGGTCTFRSREDWGSLPSDYGGIGMHKIREELPRLTRKLDLPRSHRHFISGLSKVLHGVVQPHSVTSLLRSNCRQNDQFIDQPNSMKGLRNMREENKFVQEPSYSSHVCRTALFPLSPVEGHGASSQRVFPKPTICGNTVAALSKIVQNRYKVTSYEKDYENPWLQDSNNAGKSQEDLSTLIEEEETEKQKMFSPLTLKALARRAIGSWPCWPAGSSCIISTVTGQIVEKRDVLSLDDDRDFRVLRRRLQKVEPDIQDIKERKDVEGEDAKSSEQPKNMEIGCYDESHADIDREMKRSFSKKWEIKSKNYRRNKTDRKWRRTYNHSSAPLTLQSATVPSYRRVEEESLVGMTTEMLQTIRAEETVYRLLQSLMRKQPNQTNTEDKTSSRMVHTYKMERRDHPVLLPPNPLHKTLSYSGDRIADRLGVRYKTVAMKRYHGIHPETVPDLRDFRPPVRKCKFLGYHTSMFR